MKFCTLTLGCKVNQFETQAIENALIARGHASAEAGSGCDVCIVNTCAVTAESARKSRQAVRRMKKFEPQALVAVCGCLSQLDPEAAAAIGADLIGGSGDRLAFALEIERVWNSEFLTPNPYPPTPNPLRPTAAFEELPVGGSHGRVRALLKVQDGCDNFCAYCVIPYARGPIRSLPLDRAVAQARQLEADGFREIVITGVEISSYEFQGMGLFDLLSAISAAAPSARLRLGSLDPAFVTERFVEDLSALQNLCPHFHLSLQSGCDETLQRMGRKYGVRRVSEAIGLLRGAFPNCGITADLIVGFPGETAAEFAQTMEFIRACAFSDMHIFPFSQRPGTRAASMSGQIEKNIRLKRARAAAAVAAEMARAFKLSRIGTLVDVLFERERGGHWVGHSGNYLEVSAISGGAKNALEPVLITGVSDGLVFGEICDE